MGVADIIAIIILSIVFVPIGIFAVGFLLVLLSWTWPIVLVVIVIALLVKLIS